ncbi:hypothetical protein HHK36_013575 [Tetracentron sinense]|uniref:Uncharacterized protein n=1 Tax=Tetracentron sinense TaxID=13715 RepID=A0A835DDG6_TETSI|nr:hypothetical protein HHK36_013575 [Tetracentron sinense]
MVALWCVQDSPKARPQMSSVGPSVLRSHKWKRYWFKFYNAITGGSILHGDIEIFITFEDLALILCLDVASEEIASNPLEVSNTPVHAIGSAPRLADSSLTGDERVYLPQVLMSMDASQGIILGAVAIAIALVLSCYCYFLRKDERITRNRHAQMSNGTAVNSWPALNVVQVLEGDAETMERFLRDMAMEKPIRFSTTQLYNFTDNYNTRLGNHSDSLAWFPRHVWEEYEKGELVELTVACGIEEKDREKAERVSTVALWCVQDSPEARPQMSSVVRMLEGKVEIMPPPKPFRYLYSQGPSVLEPISGNDIGSSSTITGGSNSYRDIEIFINFEDLALIWS